MGFWVGSAGRISGDLILHLELRNLEKTGRDVRFVVVSEIGLMVWFAW